MDSEFIYPHDRLPEPLKGFMSSLLMENTVNADWYLAFAVIFLSTLAIYQVRTKPKPIPLKKLPKRPALCILFKPDDDVPPPSQSAATTFRSTVPGSRKDRDLSPDGLLYSEDENEEDELLLEDENMKPAEERPPSFAGITDLPDSFAPLLSSSSVEFLRQQLTADLVHAVHAQAEVRLAPGIHEIPLDRDSSRPQLRLYVKEGCRLSASAHVGSDQFSLEEDLDASRQHRTQPIVKQAGVVFDPPLPLTNVAPTLIHIPTLFEDNGLPLLRKWTIFRFLLQLLDNTSSFLERCLWILESKCQIHLSKVRIVPVYKGMRKDKDGQDWRLSLSFSGHVLLFGFLPVPFIGVVLPAIIIPQPHALLDRLLTKEPLASAQLKRENIAEERIALALIETASQYSAQLKVVVTPPAVGVDVTLPGGVAVAMEIGLGRDACRKRDEKEDKTDDLASNNSMSSWTTYMEASGSQAIRKASSNAIPEPYDANLQVPWSLHFACKGSVSHEKLSLHILKMEAKHGQSGRSSYLGARGSFALWRPTGETTESLPLRRIGSSSQRRATTASHPHLQSECPSVTSILLFPDESSSFHNDLRLLQYDYVFDVDERTTLDALTASIGATHPMLNGGTMYTLIFDSLYACGSMSARENAILDPTERHRKRNILRHLPATDFKCGIQNIYIPPESDSYSDDGQTLFLPELERGRMRIHIMGGLDNHTDDQSVGSSLSNNSNGGDFVSDGLKLVANFDAPVLRVNSESTVKEFPELDVFDGVKLRTKLNSVLSGSVHAHLRPQKLENSFKTTGPNVLNPLEAYEIDFSGSSASLKLKECAMSLGHRRLMFPAESSFAISVVESVVDMGFEGKTQCEISWDFQGVSPILQVTRVGQMPEDAAPENKKQVSVLIAPLRQGRISCHVSSVGGIKIDKAATSREDKDGLYDWKFFNALLSPDDESAGRIFDVLHDKRSMGKLLEVAALINHDVHRILKYLLNQVWRAKEILDQENVSETAHAIPMAKLARIVCLFLTDDIAALEEVLPLVQNVVEGRGLDVVKVKDLIHQHVDQYDEWAPEIDRAVRWMSVAVGSMPPTEPYVQEHVLPLSNLPQYRSTLEGIPSAKELYELLSQQSHLPLDTSFSNLVSRVAPYLTFPQVEYILQSRAPDDWQSNDLRRIRYVYAIKRKIQEIAESYGGLSFLPQSFLLSVFLGEATRSRHRVSVAAPTRSQRTLRTSGTRRKKKRTSQSISSSSRKKSTRSTLTRLRRRRVEQPLTPLQQVSESKEEERTRTPAEKIASSNNLPEIAGTVPRTLFIEHDQTNRGPFQLGDSLLGPQDVAILLQAGLTSVMKSSTVVQLNQRMLLDLICSQPRSFAVAVLAEIGTPSGQGNPRSLTSALMALLELDQTSFKSSHKIDMHTLLESWLPGLKIPRREDYMAGGRWARQSYYEALVAVANSVLDDAESYMALKGHVQRVRCNNETDVVPGPRAELDELKGLDLSKADARLLEAVKGAMKSIEDADQAGKRLLEASAGLDETSESYLDCINLYRESFDNCAAVLDLDKHAFHASWFRNYYKRNYDALMIKSVVDNLVEDVDGVRHWYVCFHRIRQITHASSNRCNALRKGSMRLLQQPEDDFFLVCDAEDKQSILDAVLDCLIFEETTREELREDPLLRLMISNPPGEYNFNIVTAMGVITDGKKGIELQNAFERLESQRGVQVVRSDTGTARSLEFNASKIREAIEGAVQLKKPYGLLGYSQGCANALMVETMMLSGSPKQQELATANGGLVCRQLLFSAANGSFHAPAMEKKVIRLIVMSEEFFKYQQGYFSRALSSSVLEIVNSVLDSPEFHKTMGGADSFLIDGCRAFWRESQHLDTVPTCTLKGVMEPHTTPESLEMISHLLTKQSISSRHDSQVHVFDAVGYPLYFNNRNATVLKKCAIGEGAVQRTHHWSPLSDEVEFLCTQRDLTNGVFDCAKDRHVFPWVDVNARFGFIKYKNTEENTPKTNEAHPLKLISEQKQT